MTFVHSGTEIGIRNTVPNIREREFEILFPTFGNGKGNEKYFSRHSGTGTGIRNTVPNIREQEREWEMAANFPKYWENNQEILNSSKTLHIV